MIDEHEGGYLHRIPDPAARTSSALPPTPARAEVLGTLLAISDYEEVIDWMRAVIAADARAWVTAAAVNLVMSAREQERTRAAIGEATLAVPDGQPLVWALRALGHAHATRVYGPELMARFCARAAGDGIPVFLYGGRTPDALARLEASLCERYPGLTIAGSFWPPFRELDAREEESVVAQIEDSKARVVWVGTGQPKQELWMARMRARLSAPLLVGVGAAFDFHAGLVPQAPAWMQRNGLEWLYRLAHEPRRLWRRYARYNPLFVAAFTAQWMRNRRRS